jgi:hypothetical protein
LSRLGLEACLAYDPEESFIAGRQVVGSDALPKCCQAGEGISDLTAAGQQPADEGTSGRSHDCIGSRQVDTGLVQP